MFQFLSGQGAEVNSTKLELHLFLQSAGRANKAAVVFQNKKCNIYLGLFVNDHMILSVEEDFHHWPIHSANISQIFLFTTTKEPHNIQLVPDIWDTSFLLPVKKSFDSLVADVSFQLVPKYISKVKVISKTFTLKKVVSLENGGKGTNFYNADIEWE